MNKTVLSAALIASTLCANADLHAQQAILAQASATVVNNDNEKSSAGHLVLNGDWVITVDLQGKLCIFDKNENLVRILDGNLNDNHANSSVFNSPSTYPLNLSVDKSGNLHIIDLSLNNDGNKATAILLPHENNSFSDPDMPAQLNPRNANQIVCVNPRITK